MKTIQQIDDFIKTVYGVAEIDELAISHFVLQNFNIKAKFGEYLKTSGKEGYRVTFDEFKEWVSLESPDYGEIIVYNKTDIETIAIVQEVRLNDFTIACTLKGGLLDITTAYMPNTGYRKAREDEKILIYKKLADKGFEWSVRHNRVVEKFLPASSNFVKWKSVSEGEGFGYFDEISKSGDVKMYAVKKAGSEIEFSMNINLGPVEGLQFELASQNDKKIFAQELERHGKVWNAYLKRIEPVDMRSKKGSPYWYINDKWNVTMSHDTNSITDKKRYWSGNYFCCPEEGTAFLRLLQENRKKQLASLPSRLSL